MVGHNVDHTQSNYHPDIAYNPKKLLHMNRLIYSILRVPANKNKSRQNHNNKYNVLETVPRIPKVKITNNDQENIRRVSKANQQMRQLTKNFYIDARKDKSLGIVGAYGHFEHTAHYNKNLHCWIYHPHIHLHFIVKNQAKNVSLHVKNFKQSNQYKMQQLWYKQIKSQKWNPNVYVMQRDKNEKIVPNNDLYYSGVAYSNVAGKNYTRNLQFGNKVCFKRHSACIQPLDSGVNMSYNNSNDAVRDIAYQEGKECSKYMQSEKNYKNMLFNRGIRCRYMSHYTNPYNHKRTYIGNVDKIYYAYDRAEFNPDGTRRHPRVVLADYAQEVEQRAEKHPHYFNRLKVNDYHYESKNVNPVATYTGDINHLHQHNHVPTYVSHSTINNATFEPNSYDTQNRIFSHFLKKKVWNPSFHRFVQSSHDRRGTYYPTRNQSNHSQKILKSLNVKNIPTKHTRNTEKLEDKNNKIKTRAIHMKYSNKYDKGYSESFKREIQKALHQVGLN